MFEWIVISDNAFLESVCIFDFPHTSPSWFTFYLLPAAYLYYNPFLLLTTEYWDTLFLKLVPPLSNCFESHSVVSWVPNFYNTLPLNSFTWASHRWHQHIPGLNWAFRFPPWWPPKCSQPHEHLLLISHSINCWTCNLELLVHYFLLLVTLHFYNI